jgi:RHS repeat-associated protein
VVIDPTRGATGTTVWKWDLAGEAFGTTAPNQDPDGDATQFVFNLRFPGQRYDSASGLNYNYFRDYETAAGRYVESDPIGLRGGRSTYSYVADRPFNYADPKGLAALVCWNVPSATNMYWFPERGYPTIYYAGRQCIEIDTPEETACFGNCDKIMNKCSTMMGTISQVTVVPCTLIGLASTAAGLLGAGLCDSYFSTWDQQGAYAGCDAGYKNCRRNCTRCK